MNNKHPNIITWDYLEKYMAVNPSSVLAIYALGQATFLDDKPIIMDGSYWGIDHGKFRQIPSEIFGLVKFMIKSNQDTWPPGVKLDKLIAERVLGWYQYSDISGPRACWLEKEKADEIMGSGPCPRKHEALHLNHFSTDIKAARDLAEKFKLCVVPIGDGWTATRLGQLLVDGERNKAPTAPHAICLAALFYASENDE